MARSMKQRLEAAIRDADEKNRARLLAARAVPSGVAKAFAPVSKAAREISEQMLSMPALEFATSPDSVSLRLGDLELWLSYDPQSKAYIGEESAHSWYDGERYAKRYEWHTADECVDALIRFCAEYLRFARALNQAAATK
jgi:hypothetical protein